MITGIFLFTLKVLTTFFGGVLLLRVYLRLIGIPSNDPVNQFATSFTQWAVRMVSGFIPRRRGIEWPAIFTAYLTAIVYLLFNWLMGNADVGFFGFFLAGAFLVVYWAVEFAMWAALVFCILSWVNPTTPLYRTLAYLCAPFLSPLRKIIPTWRNFDFSPIVFFLAANLILAFVGPLTLGAAGF